MNYIYPNSLEYMANTAVSTTKRHTDKAGKVNKML